MLEKYLQDLGLNEKEAVVYTTLLQVDDISVLDLSKKTSIKRSTVYIVLESLIKKGLVTEVQISKKVHFRAEPPERLLTFVERQKVLLDEHSKKLADIIPQFKSIQRESGMKPIVKYYEGKEGILAMNDELFENNSGGGTAYLVYSRDLLDEIFPESDRQGYRDTRIKKKVKTEVLYNYSKGEIASNETGNRYKVDEKKYPISCDISVYEDKVRIGILGSKLSGVFIKSKDLAESLKSIIRLGIDGLKK